MAKVLATPPPAPVAAPAPAVAPETPPAEPSGGVIAPELLADKYTQAGVAVVCGISTGAILFMGAHAAPKGDESAAMVKAYADCFRHYGYAPEPPAWLGPVIATGVWLGPQLQDERTQTNLQKWKARLIGWWLALRGKFAARAATNAAVEIAAAGTGTPPPSP